MRDIFEEEQALPEGLWLIKWVDCISMGRGLMNSPRINVILQKLEQPDVPALNRLSSAQTSLLIGRRPGQPTEEVAIWAKPRQVLAGMLPLLRIGDVVRGSRAEGALCQRELTLTLTKDTEVTSAGIFDACEPPKDWSGNYRTLNRFEYELGTHREVSRSRCLKIRTGKIEYIIPCFVILKTFYGFHTKLANAICNGSWDRRYNEVISTFEYESGIGTYVHPTTGAWHIVVQHGLTRAHAVRLAALYFDPYARECANAIHASSISQTHGMRADAERYWFADAKIPYRWDETPLTMRVKAFPLRAHRPSAADGMRYLVTSIDATSWPFPDQEIHSETANSNAVSLDRAPKQVQEPYRKNKAPPVHADEDALLDHHSDAYKNAADNQVDANDFSFLNPPCHLQQQKSTHKQYQGSSSVPSEAPSLTLSAGNTAPGEEKPAPLVAESRDRRLAPQLQLLLNALDTLLATGEITAFNVLGPPEFSHLRQMRNGTSCWSFVSEDQLRAVRAGQPATGWTFIFDAPAFEGGQRRPVPRCLLIVRIELDGHELLLFEVEPRLTENAYRFYLIEPTEGLDWPAIETAMLALRAYSGRVPASARYEAFRGLTSRRTLARNHAYERNDNNEITGLMTSALRRALGDACSGVDAQPEAVDNARV